MARAMTEAREMMVCLFADTILLMEVNKKLTVGEAVDVMLKKIEAEGFVIVRKGTRND